MRGGRRRFSAKGCAALAKRLSTASILLALLAFPAVSPAAGGVAGTLTEAPPGHSPIQGMEVCAFTLNPNASGEEGEGEFGCAETTASGEYEIDGLNAGSFGVCFSMPLVTTLNFIAKCYDDKGFEQEPTPVTVTEGAVTHHIDAQLEPGAELEGTVTTAGTGAPLEGAFACAAFHTGGSEGGEVVSCTKSGAGGAYTLAGVPAGTFDLYFFWFGHEVLASGYFGGGHTRDESTPVTVAAHEVKTGLNVALALVAFHPGEPPAGGPEGASGESSGAGSGGAHSGGGSGAAAGLSLATSRIRVGHDGRARVSVLCSGTSACRGRIALRERRRHGHGKHMLVLGSVRYSLAPGAKKVLELRLDSVGRHDLHAHHGLLPFHAAIVPSSPTPAVVSVKDVTLVVARGRGHGHG